MVRKRAPPEGCAPGRRREAAGRPERPRETPRLALPREDLGARLEDWRRAQRPPRVDAAAEVGLGVETLGKIERTAPASPASEAAVERLSAGTGLHLRG